MDSINQLAGDERVAKYKDHLKGSFRVAMEQAAGKRSLVAGLARMQAWADQELGDQRRRVSDAAREGIVMAVERGATVAAVADRFATTPPTVRKILREARLSKVPEIRKHQQMLPKRVRKNKDLQNVN